MGTKRATAPVLDHIVSFAAGGAHVAANVQCACNKCNAAKGRAALGQTRLF